MKVDNFLRELLFRKFRIAGMTFDFLEALLAVCITGVGLVLRTSFPDSGMPHPLYLLAEWYLAVAGAVLVHQITGNGRKSLLTYSVLLILPTVIADGTILRNNACVGALLIVSALLFLENGCGWLFSVVLSAALLLHVRYVGLLAVCMLLWQMRKLNNLQLVLPVMAAAARFVYSYRAWMGAGYTLTTFHWPNIYEIIGNTSMQGQSFEPLATVGLFLTFGLLVIGVWVFSQSKWEEQKSPMILELMLFFGLAAAYFLPYMDQTAGYLFCVLAVMFAFTEPKWFLVPVFLQIVTFAGYQEAVNGESMMPMWVFSVIQLGILVVFAAHLLKKAKVVDLCSRIN